MIHSSQAAIRHQVPMQEKASSPGQLNSELTIFPVSFCRPPTSICLSMRENGRQLAGVEKEGFVLNIFDFKRSRSQGRSHGASQFLPGANMRPSSHLRLAAFIVCLARMGRCSCWTLNKIKHHVPSQCSRLRVPLCWPQRILKIRGSLS